MADMTISQSYVSTIGKEVIMGTLVLAGRDEIEEKIGDGGMAVVYKARDRQLNRFVAIKILKKEFIADQTFVENFIREAKAAASLLHPNIVTIHDAGKDRDIYYIVMEYIEGKPLSEIIAAEAPLDYKRCIRIAKQVASALSLAHRNNIIHRDVKPHNILITTDGTAKITDFGIAKAVSDGTIINDSGVIMGSVHYFSPEQSRGQYVDEKSDIYSLGIVLYEMITGRVPFDADNPVTIAVMHMNDTIIPPSKLVKGVPPGLDQIVMKATAKYQSDRFGSIDEMYKALDNVNFITGIIDDPVVAGFVAPTSIKDESPGNGYSTAVEPAEKRYNDEFFGDYAGNEEPDYRSSRRSSADDDFYDDFDDAKKPVAFAANKKGLDDDYDDFRDERKTAKRNEGEPKKGKLDQKQKLILIIAAVAIAVVLSIPLSKVIIGFFAYDPVRVPDVIGLYIDEATDILTEGGFSVKINIVPLPPVQSSALPQAGEEMTAITEDVLQDPQFTQSDGTLFREGQVMDQDPLGGEMVKPGTEVVLKVAGAPAAAPENDPDALGPPMEVPDLKGKTKSSAEYAIVSAGFQIGGVSYENSDLPIDTVISQSPNAGEMTPGNSKIHIIISLGPREELITVPDMRGRTVEEAQATATQLGLTLTVREVDTTDPAQSGRVLEQNPAPNATVKKGGAVTIDVGTARYSVQIINGAASVSNARAGERVDITARAAAGGEVFSGWQIDSNNTALNPGGMTSTTAYFLMPEGNVKITAIFTAANITVPNVVGMTEANARAQLTQFVVQVQSVQSPAAQAGLVVGQTPGGGTPAQPNSVVALTIGDGTLP
jgi:serine/threonine-protein kinase